MYCNKWSWLTVAELTIVCSYQEFVILLSLFTVADRFSLDGLKALAASELCEKINVDNVVNTYVSATSELPIIGKIFLDCT